MKLLLTLSIFCLTLNNVLAFGTINGSVPLNSGTFDKLVLKFPYSLVRFGKFLNHGAEQDAFRKVASSHGSHQKLLIADVHIAEFGQKDNSDLAERFSVKRKDYPVYKLFSKKVGLEKSVQYGGDKNSSEEIIRFIIRETGLTLNLPSCSKTLDAFSIRVLKYEDKENLIKQVEVIVKDMTEGEEKIRANIYLKIFKKIQEKGNDFFNEESKRVEKLLKGKLSQRKREDLMEKSRIITCIVQAQNKKD